MVNFGTGVCMIDNNLYPRKKKVSNGNGGRGDDNRDAKRDQRARACKQIIASNEGTDR